MGTGSGFIGATGNQHAPSDAAGIIETCDAIDHEDGNSEVEDDTLIMMDEMNDCHSDFLRLCTSSSSAPHASTPTPLKDAACKSGSTPKNASSWHPWKMVAGRTGVKGGD